ncbi:MAG: hypothetical protein J6386_05770 [Candidatus Synoicihabitans palmerolidicus]|nr:hypothetical protein [Candidatus Synoicihabitans palmerolidicus]
MTIELYREVTSREDLSADRALRIARRLANLGVWNELDLFLSDLDTVVTAKYSPADQLSVLNLEAQSDLAQGRTDSAAAKLTKVVEVDPLNGKALLLLADYH